MAQKYEAWSKMQEDRGAKMKVKRKTQNDEEKDTEG